MNLSALITVEIFAAVLLSIFGALYIGASRSYSKGEMDIEGIRLLRWALLEYVTLYCLLEITAFLTQLSSLRGPHVLSLLITSNSKLAKFLMRIAS